MAFRISRKRGVNVGRVIGKLVAGVLGLYVGGTIMNALGTTMNATSSQFYQGLSLIGWTTGTANPCDGQSVVSVPNCIVRTTGTGVLSVIGIIVIASIVLEFIHVSF